MFQKLLIKTSKENIIFYQLRISIRIRNVMRLSITYSDKTNYK